MTRMTTVLGLVGLVAAVGLTGCDLDQPYHDMSHMPPPGYEAESGEPMPMDEAAKLEPVDPDAAPPVADVPEVQQAEEPASDPDAQTYTVRRGDTLWSIAEQVYGEGQRWRDIVEANPELHPEQLHVGQELTLP